MDFKKHIETAWKMTLEFIIPLIFMTLIMIVVSTVSFGILAPVTMAGYIHSVILMVRDRREPKFQDVFSQMKLFLPLLGFAIVVFIATCIGLLLVVVPGIVISVGVTYFCLYMIPLMTDKNMGIIEAVKVSFSMTAKKDKILEHIIVLIVFLGVTALGGSTLIGCLFTQPLATIFLVSVYLENVSEMSLYSDLVQK
ncbi:MAG: hypothetical protein GY795_44295 [Desulfobacterales bacterium]|nr:hypothetical protein [Desulfobacterales bacterium]